MNAPQRFSRAARINHEPVMAKNLHAPEHPVCPSCKGRKVDRFGFDCTTCFGEGTVDE